MNPTPTRGTLSLRGVAPKAVQARASTELNDERFWFVFRRPDGLKPRKRHPNKDAAIAEALRLAALFPGVRFHVYEATCVAKVLK
jgi:hypothetical protein